MLLEDLPTMILIYLLYPSYFFYYFPKPFIEETRKNVHPSFFSHPSVFCCFHFLLLYFFYVFKFYSVCRLLIRLVSEVIIRLSYRNKLSFCTAQVQSQMFLCRNKHRHPPFFSLRII